MFLTTISYFIGTFRILKDDKGVNLFCTSLHCIGVTFYTCSFFFFFSNILVLIVALWTITFVSAKKTKKTHQLNVNETPCRKNNVINVIVNGNRKVRGKFSFLNRTRTVWPALR